LNENAEHIISEDSNGNKLNGGKNYKLNLPANIPASEFWSLIVYDSITRQIICTDQLWPSIHSNCKKLVFNSNNSIDICFGADASKHIGNNYIQTIPEKKWYAILRLYGLSESWFDNRWIPGKIVPTD
jgi:hypothetical protein